MPKKLFITSDPSVKIDMNKFSIPIHIPTKKIVFLPLNNLNVLLYILKYSFFKCFLVIYLSPLKNLPIFLKDNQPLHHFLTLASLLNLYQ